MILVVLLVVILAFAVSPAAPYARGWGYYPSSGLGLLALVLIVLFLTGNLGAHGCLGRGW